MEFWGVMFLIVKVVGIVLGIALGVIWQSQAEKRKKKARSNAKLQLLLRAAQTDIEKLRAQSERELAEAEARTEQVRNQLGKEK